MPPSKSSKKFDKIQLYGIFNSPNTNSMLRKVAPLAIAFNRRIYAPFLIEVVLLKAPDDMQQIRRLQRQHRTQVSIGILIDRDGTAHIGAGQINKFIQQEYAKPRDVATQSPIYNRFKNQAKQDDLGEIDNYDPSTGGPRAASTSAGSPESSTTRHFDAPTRTSLPQIKASSNPRSVRKSGNGNAKTDNLIGAYAADIAPLGFDKQGAGLSEDITNAFKKV